MNLTKYEQKDFELIRIIAEKGRIQDARAAGAKWVARAGGNEGARARRNAALESIFAGAKGVGSVWDSEGS